MSLNKMEAQRHLNTLKALWKQLETTPGIFAYALDVALRKTVPGKHNFYVELNPQRLQLRRKPQEMAKVAPEFDDNKFNFSKVNPLEVMMRVSFKDVETQLLINKSPLTQYHMLICPELERKLPQRLTEYSLQFAVSFLRNVSDKDCRIGYNSPGALASVNHLHLHLVHMPVDLFIDRAELTKLAAGNAIYRLSDSMPINGICFLVEQMCDDSQVAARVHRIHQFTEWLINRNIPHNVFITHNRQGIPTNEDALKIFVFARGGFTSIKNLGQIYVGFCELAGFFTVGQQEIFDEFTEETALRNLRENADDIYAEIFAHLQE